MDEYVIGATRGGSVHNLKPNRLRCKRGHEVDVRQRKTIAGTEKNDLGLEIHSGLKVLCTQRFWRGHVPVEENMLRGQYQMAAKPIPAHTDGVGFPRTDQVDIGSFEREFQLFPASSQDRHAL